MLRLGRKDGERIAMFHDGEFVGWFELVAATAGHAQIGFDAPQSWRYVREEALTEAEKRLTDARQAG